MPILTIAAMFSPSVSASKCAVEPALLIGMLVVSPMTKTLVRPSMLSLVGWSESSRSGPAVLLDHFHAAVGGDRDQQVVLHFEPSSLRSTFFAPSTSLMLKKVSYLMPSGRIPALPTWRRSPGCARG